MVSIRCNAAQCSDASIMCGSLISRFPQKRTGGTPRSAAQPAITAMSACCSAGQPATSTMCGSTFSRFPGAKKDVVSHVSPGAEEACCVTCFACSRRTMLCHMFHLGLKIAAGSHVCSVLEEACCFPNKVPQKGSSTKFPQVHLSCLLVLRSDNFFQIFSWSGRRKS